MRCLHDPRQVMALTQTDLAGLVGKWVDASIADSNYWFGRVVERWEGAAGICAAVTQSGDPRRLCGEYVTIQWEWGMEWAYIPGQPVFLAVCDEHGDHTDASGLECLEAFELERAGATEATGASR